MTREELRDYVEMQRSLNNIPYHVYSTLIDGIDTLEKELKTGSCKDCKWWKNKDGFYRRGSHVESQCPINRREVFEGNGYCFMFKPQESKDK